MSLIGEVKEIADLVRQLGNLELYKRIVALEGEIIGLTRENRSLQEENEQLITRLQLKEQMRFEMPFYYSRLNQRAKAIDAYKQAIAAFKSVVLICSFFSDQLLRGRGGTLRVRHRLIL